MDWNSEGGTSPSHAYVEGGNPASDAIVEGGNSASNAMCSALAMDMAEAVKPSETLEFYLI
jgi:hypothetical protein